MCVGGGGRSVWAILVYINSVYLILELANGLRSRVISGKERGMSSVGTSEDGEESSSLQDEEDEVEMITEMLSTVAPPQVQN